MSRDNWQTMAELGWLSIPFSEADGGFGGNIVDLSVVMEEMGKGLVVEPFFPTVVLFGGVVARAGDEAQRASILESVISGETLGAFAYVERQSRYAIADCKTSATNGDGYTLNGRLLSSTARTPTSWLYLRAPQAISLTKTVCHCSWLMQTLKAFQKFATQ